MTEPDQTPGTPTDDKTGTDQTGTSTAAAPAQERQTPGVSAPAQERPENTAEDATDWKVEARKWEKLAKTNREKAEQFDKLDAQNKTEAQKATERAEKAEQSYTVAVKSAVNAEIRAAATGWAYPDDAPRYVDDPTSYVDKSGEIDRKTIASDLAAVLKERPHLAKQAESAPSNGAGMAADPSVGAPGNGSIADQIRQAESKGDVRQSLALKASQMLNQNK